MIDSESSKSSRNCVVVDRSPPLSQRRRLLRNRPPCRGVVPLLFWPFRCLSWTQDTLRKLCVAFVDLNRARNRLHGGPSSAIENQIIARDSPARSTSLYFSSSSHLLLLLSLPRHPPPHPPSHTTQPKTTPRPPPPRPPRPSRRTPTSAAARSARPSSSTAPRRSSAPASPSSRARSRSAPRASTSST